MRCCVSDAVVSFSTSHHEQQPQQQHRGAAQSTVQLRLGDAQVHRDYNANDVE